MCDEPKKNIHVTKSVIYGMRLSIKDKPEFQHENPAILGILDLILMMWFLVDKKR